MGAIFVPSEMRLYSGGVGREAKCCSLSDSVAKVLSTDKSATDLSECCTITHINSESDLLPICFQDNFPLRLHQSVRRVWMWRCGLLSILSVAIGNHHEVNFSVRFDSNIPRQVGIAGSSAIIVATLRCLMEFYGVQIPLDVQPSLVLAGEVEELGRPAYRIA